MLAQQKHTFRPAVEALEERALMSVADGGPCIHLRVTFAVYNHMGELHTNGRWSYHRPVQEGWYHCHFQNDHHEGDPNSNRWVYDDTNPNHPIGAEESAVRDCARGRDRDGYVYMARRAGHWRRVSAQAPGGHGLHVWNGRSWAGFLGSGERLGVGADGAPWVVQAGHRIWRLNWRRRTWERLPGSASDVDVGADGSAWIVGTNPSPGGYDIYSSTRGGDGTDPRAEAAANGAERKYCLLHPWRIFRCRKADKLAKKASASAKRRFPDRTLHNGVGDAYRHCYWSGLMTFEWGKEQAEKFGDLHEKNRGAPQEEKLMDLHNNFWGRYFGDLYKHRRNRQNKLADRCQRESEPGGLLIVLMR